MVAFRFAALAGLAAHIAAQGSPLPGYSVVPLTWEVETSPGGAKFNLTGTVQQVITQLQDLDPTYDATLPPNSKRAMANGHMSSDLAKRDVICGGLGNAQKTRIEEGIRYLRTVGGRPVQGPGPNSCGRVSCSYNSAIWWCNDNGDSKTLDTFNNIADSAQLIVNNCYKSGALLGGGQETHWDNWRGIVKEDRC